MSAQDAIAGALQVCGIVLLAPLLPGLTQWIKARLQGRRGATPLQPYRERWSGTRTPEPAPQRETWQNTSHASRPYPPTARVCPRRRAAGRPDRGDNRGDGRLIINAAP